MHIVQIIKQKEADEKNRILIGQADLFEFEEPAVYSELEILERKVAEAEKQ